jgi:hypothetical protein
MSSNPLMKTRHETHAARKHAAEQRAASKEAARQIDWDGEPPIYRDGVVVKHGEGAIWNLYHMLGCEKFMLAQRERRELSD